MRAVAMVTVAVVAIVAAGAAGAVVAMVQLDLDSSIEVHGRMKVYVQQEVQMNEGPQFESQ